LIEPPNIDWKTHILSHGEVVLRGVSFVVEIYDFRKFVGGSDPVHIWVNITGLPPDLWKEEEFKRIASDHGGSLIDVDPRFWDHVDLTILRI
jgi:Domain of unknown function (DUF4283)